MMLGNYIADHLLGITILSAVVSFTVGVIFAYFLWGIRYFRVFEAESSTTLLRRKAEQLRCEQQQLRARIDSARS